jgi:hypothetical protein
MVVCIAIVSSGSNLDVCLTVVPGVNIPTVEASKIARYTPSAEVEVGLSSPPKKYRRVVRKIMLVGTLD